MLDIIIGVLVFIEVLVALLLIGIILMQQSKSGGGLGGMGGGVTETVFGAGAGNVLTRATVILASVFLGITLVLAIITGHRKQGSSIIERGGAPEAAAVVPASAPAAESATATETTPEVNTVTTKAVEAVPAPAAAAEAVPATPAAPAAVETAPAAAQPTP